MLIAITKEQFDKLAETEFAVKLVNYIDGRYYGVIDPYIPREYIDRINVENALNGSDTIEVYIAIHGALEVTDYVLTFETNRRKIQIRQSEIGNTLKTKTYDKIIEKLSKDFPGVGEMVLINQLKLERATFEGRSSTNVVATNTKSKVFYR